MTEKHKTELPLRDGQRFWSSRQQWETVGGSILANGRLHGLRDEDKVYNHDICWTISGNWYRRSDAVEMTGAGGKPMTIGEFYKWRKEQRP